MLLNTRFFVDRSLTREVFLEMAIDWLESSKQFSNIAFDFATEESFIESEDHLQKLFINNYDKKFILQLVSSKDGMIQTMNFVLDDKSEMPSLHFSEDRSFSVMSLQNDIVSDDSVPELIKNIFWEEYTGMDNDIVTDNRPHLIRKRDLSMMTSVLKNEKSFLLPVIYVSVDTKSGKTVVDDNKISELLMGQAHVFVESSPAVSKAVLDAVDDLCPDEGSVKVILPNGESTFLHKKDDIDFNDTIVNFVRKTMSAVHIDDEFNVSRLRSEHAFAKLADSEDKEVVHMCEQIIESKDSEIEALKKELESYKLQARNASIKAEMLKDNLANKEKDGNGEKTVGLIYGENEIYDGEIVDVILKVIKKEYNSMKDDKTLSKSRKFDVLGDVLEHNFPRDTDTELCECIKSAFRDGALTGDGIGYLRSRGFVIEKTGKKSPHYKLYIDGFDKYYASVPSTPSDKYHGMKNLVSEFCNMLFGY